LPEPLLWARGTPPLPDDRLVCVALELACALEAVCPRACALTADVLPPTGVEDADIRPPTAVVGTGVLLPAGVGTLEPTAGASDLRPTVSVGDPLPTAGVGDLLYALGAGVFSIAAGVRPFASAAGTEASMPARCWTGGGLPVVSISKSSDFEKSTPPDEELASGVDSGVVCGERPSLCCLLFSFSWASLLSLFLRAVAFASSFLFFSS